MHKLKAAIAGILTLLVASCGMTPIFAQTFPTVPSQSVIGRLGTPGTTGPSQAIPLATFQDLATSFTQTGTGAVPVTFDQLLRGKVYTPEMFGARASPLGTSAASVADSTAAIQKAVNSLQTMGGGTLLLGPGVYAVTNVRISTKNIYIKGSGIQATSILHKPTEASAALTFSAGAGVLFNTGISDLSIVSADTTTSKIAIDLLDVSNTQINNVTISHYPVDGTNWRGGNSIGLRTAGREKGVVRNFQAYADSPIVIDVNANSAFISLDSWIFEDILLLAADGKHCITVAPDAVLFNTVFSGTQNWIGGTDGFHWVDNGITPYASFGLYFSGIKSEQAETGGAGYTVNIQHRINIWGLKITDSIAGDRNGIKLRNVRTTTIDNFTYAPVGGGAGSDGLDLDSTSDFVKIRNSFWNAGTTASISSLNLSEYSNFLAGRSAAIPVDGEYTHATPLKFFDGVIVNGLTASRSVATDANKKLVSVTTAAAAVADANTFPSNQGAGMLLQTFTAVKAWIKAWITKTDVGLGNVDNTSDATKNAAAATLTNKTIDTSGPNTLAVNGVDISTAWAAYSPVLTSEAGGAIGTGNTVTGSWKQVGKTVHVRIKIVIGASGLGSATQVAVSLPSTATADAILVAKNRTAGLTGSGDVGTLSLTKALLLTSSGGILAANSATTIVSGTYEQ